jgi:rare lipoprotein A
MRIHAAPVIFAAMLLIVITTGCARKARARNPPPVAPASAPVPTIAARIGATETGLASWYGLPYDGRAAASGEIFHMDQFVAAHRTLPFGTWVEVTDLDNRKLVNVRVIDRGPFVEGRIIDLSQAAAREIGMLGPGIANVRLKVIAPPQNAITRAPESGQPDAGSSAQFSEFAVQAGAFSDYERAESLRASLAARFDDARVIQGDPLWRVVLGHHLTIEAANKTAARVRRVVGEALVVPDR